MTIIEPNHSLRTGPERNSRCNGPHLIINFPSSLHERSSVPVRILQSKRDIYNGILKTQPRFSDDRLNKINKSSVLLASKLLGVSGWQINMNPTPFTVDPCVQNRNRSIEVQGCDVNSPFLVKSYPILLPFVINATHIRDTYFADLSVSHCDFSGKQRATIKAFFKTVRIFFGCRQKSFVFGIGDDFIIKTVGQVSFVAIHPIFGIFLTVKTKADITPGGGQYLCS